MSYNGIMNHTRSHTDCNTQRYNYLDSTLKLMKIDPEFSTESFIVVLEIT